MCRTVHGLWLPAAFAVFVAAHAIAEDARCVVRGEDTGAALLNPGMGWVLHFYDNVPANYGSRLAPSDTVDEFPGLTVVYLRIPWSYIEPEEGRFNWAVVDGPAQRWIAKGKQVAFRFSCSESWMRYATPEWVKRAGAKGYDFRPGEGVVEGGPFWEPAYDDPVFLAKLEIFLKAAAARYDGNPEVAFFDVGSLGVWGEGHTWSSTKLHISTETTIKHIDLHCRYFKHTLLAANDDFSFGGSDSKFPAMAAIRHAVERGLTLRDDSILVQGGKSAYFHAKMAEDFWPNVPVILESEHYGGSKARGNWKDEQYLQAVEDYHASYVSIHWWPREFLEACRGIIDRINPRLGYRLQLVEASWPAKVRVEGRFGLTAKWRNAGVAPCYPGGFPALTLKDDKGGIAGVFVDEGFDVRKLPVGAPGKAEAVEQKAEFMLPFNLAAGRYDAYVSVGTRTGTPRIALPLPGDDGQRRYRAGTLRVTGDYDVRVGELRREGEAWLLPLTWTVHRPLPGGVRPFCHFDSGGAIVFQGEPKAGLACTALEKAGVVELGCVFKIPESARGKKYSVRVGLFVPSRLGRADERMIPGGGEPDRRVLVGDLAVAQDGGVRFGAAGR
ncbi:MAG: DUF4832 domain-containing protein [Phycisphaerae bacterium]|nr:DUF4832 domain-containing protein [Phycisphaerae bacterium]